MRLAATAFCATALAACATERPISFDAVLALESPAADARDSYGSGALQFGELWLPDGPGPHPVVAFIHGGCWQAAYGVDHGRPLAGALAQAGFAVWAIEYRRLGDPGGGWPGTLLDVAAGIDHLATLARVHPLDLDRVAFMGHSAGGHLALWAAARPGLAQDSPFAGAAPLKPSLTVGLAAISDLETYGTLGSDCANAVADLLGGTPDTQPARYLSASPIRQLPLASPVTLIHGLQDTIVPPAQSQAFATAAAAVGTQVELLEPPGAGHFNLIHPGTPAFREVRAELKRGLGL